MLSVRLFHYDRGLLSVACVYAIMKDFIKSAQPFWAADVLIHDVFPKSIRATTHRYTHAHTGQTFILLLIYSNRVRTIKIMGDEVTSDVSESTQQIIKPCNLDYSRICN